MIKKHRCQLEVLLPDDIVQELIGLLIYANRNFFLLDTLFQGDQGPVATTPGISHLIIQQVHQVFVVACIEFGS